jgi:hypothetical protein
MKFLNIAIALFCINIAFAMVNFTGLFGYSHSFYSEWFSSVDQNKLQDEKYTQSLTEDTSVLDTLWSIAKGLWFFVKVLGITIFAFYWTLQSFGMPVELCYLFSLPVYLIYFIALIQIIRGNGFENAW